MRLRLRASLAAPLLLAAPARAQAPAAPAVLFENVRIFDGTGDRLSAPSHVLVQDGRVARISTAPIAPPAGATVTRIAGGGRTLMPGLIDVHTHLAFATIAQLQLLTTDVGFVHLAAGRAAGEMLLRGFTSVRDVGGPTFGLKLAIDNGLVPGPRIWPSGAMISQTGGHADFRLPTELPAAVGGLTYAERQGAAAIADSPDEVRRRAREQLALGASQLKLHAGGGISSIYDPIDVTQYTVAELRAAVEAAENWGTYVTVHAYTPRAVRQAIEAGVKCIEHGHLLDAATVKLMADRGVWWSLQPFADVEGQSDRYPEGSANRRKQLTVYRGTDSAYAMARRYGVKVAFGTDVLFSQAAARRQGADLARVGRYMPAADVLKMATSVNAELLALSGERNPYPGALGVVREGALADLLLVDGDPLADLALLADPDRTLLIVMKGGRIYKNTVR